MDYSAHQSQSGSAVPGEMPVVLQIPEMPHSQDTTPVPDTASPVAAATAAKNALADQLGLS